MPSSAVHTFTDPDDYAASFREAQVELTVTGRGRFTAKLTRIHLHCVRIQRFSDDLPRIAHSALASGSAMFSWLTQPGPLQLSRGVEMHSTSIMRHNEGNSNYLRSSGFACYGSMSLPVADMVSAGAAIAGCELAPPKDAFTHTPARHAMARLQRLHAAAGDLAESAREILANPDAARGLEQALIEAMVGCLDTRERRENRLAQGQHAIVMRRFHRVVEENLGEPLYIPEICKAIGVSQSTLRMCCQEHLGMAPKRYLLLRRMALARRALRQAEPDATSVTAVGTRYGFWELGRFAVAYQSLFGEPPSATLRRQSE
jgi:AraC-like DNA-binding protein